MNPLDFVMATALLLAPPETADGTFKPEDCARLRPALQTVAVSLEILDSRELRYVLTRPEDFQADVTLLRRRYRDLVDAPHVFDSLRFPDRDAVNELLAFNRACRQFIETRRSAELSRWWDHEAAYQENEQLYEIWDTVRDARCEYYYVTVRRQALKRLRELVGPHCYYAGNLPPHVPTWRFQTLN